MKIGTTELLLLLGVAVLIFGPTKLPQLGKAIGKTVGNFKRGAKEGEVGEKADDQKVDI